MIGIRRLWAAILLVGLACAAVAAHFVPVMRVGLSMSSAANGATEHSEAASRSRRDDVYIVDVASRDRRNLTGTPSQRDGAATWSPDGRYIAYTSLVDASASDPKLWETHVNYVSVQPTTGVSFGSIGAGWADGTWWYDRANRSFDSSRGPAAAWSPDGRSLAFTGFELMSWPKGGYLAIVVGVIGGSGFHAVTGRLTAAPVGIAPRDISSATDPHWAPDGHLLVYERMPGVNLYAVTPDGSGERQLTFQSPWAPPNYQISFGSWLPEGRLVVRRHYSPADRSGGPPSDECYVVQVDAPSVAQVDDHIPCGLRSQDGTRIATGSDTGLTVTGGGFEKRLARARVGLVTWAPDSRRIAYVRNWQLWVVDVVTGRSRALTGDTKRREVFTSLSWSPNGRELAFTSYLGRP